MKDKYTKSWYWRRELGRDELIKRKMAAGLPEAEAVSLVRPCDRRITSVTTRLMWWRAADQFSLHYAIDGGEPNIHFWFIIPWLFGISLRLECNWAWFKRKQPDLVNNSGDVSWGWDITRGYVSLQWNDRRLSRTNLSKRTGWYFLKDWSQILRGEVGKVEWSKAELVYEKEHSLRVVYRSERHPTVPFYQPTKIRVYKKVGTWHYSRWFPTRQTRWEVECDQTFSMRGKGENSWDCDDWTWGGYNFDTESQSCNFSCASKNPQEAVERFIESFNRYQQRGG